VKHYLETAADKEQVANTPKFVVVLAVQQLAVLQVFQVAKC
jgi:hypothetical protein